eukprot:2738533-Rhodomonas_salina.1
MAARRHCPSMTIANPPGTDNGQRQYRLRVWPRALPHPTRSRTRCCCHAWYKSTPAVLSEHRRSTVGEHGTNRLYEGSRLVPAESLGPMRPRYCLRRLRTFSFRMSSFTLPSIGP